MDRDQKIHYNKKKYAHRLGGKNTRLEDSKCQITTKQEEEKPGANKCATITPAWDQVMLPLVFFLKKKDAVVSFFLKKKYASAKVMFTAI